ncbi:MAG: hypothetical protein AAFY48_21140 [Bacteroidota bacterium]
MLDAFYAAPRSVLRSCSSLLLIFITYLPLSAQTPIAVLDFDCGNSRLTLADFLLGRNASTDREDCQSVKSMAMDALYDDSRITIVVPEITPAVEAERELQKDEDFLAGYVVDQWSQQGAEYLLTGQVLPGSKQLVLQIHRVTDRSVVTAHTQSFKIGLMAPASEQKALVEQGISILLTDFFRAKIPVVKVLAGGGKARKVLVAGGDSQGLRQHQELSVSVGGDVVGSIVVEVVEGEFFSRCRVISGGRAIAAAINNGQEVEVAIIKL